MLERWIFQAEEELDFLKLFVEIFVLTICLAFVNSLIGGNFLFLVALTSITLAYPITKYIRHQDHLELTRYQTEHSLFGRLNRQLLVGWCVFLAVTLAFLITFPLLKDVSFQANFISSITGAITQSSIGFNKIVLNNLFVAFMVGIIALISTSGLVFVLLWNSSILVYVIASAVTIADGFNILVRSIGHGLLEIAGYILMGLAASLLAYRFERFKRFPKEANLILLKHVIFITLLSILFIVVAAILEVL